MGRNDRRFAIRFGGAAQNSEGKREIDPYHDSKLGIDYAYMFSSSTLPNEVKSKLQQGQITYADVIEKVDEQTRPLILNYTATEDAKRLRLEEYSGFYSSSDFSVNKYSIYRREYDVFHVADNRALSERDDGSFNDIFKEYKGSWQPVVINSSFGKVRDFNIQADKTYQYIIYPTNKEEDQNTDLSTYQQVFANYNGLVFDPVAAQDEEHPFVRGDADNSWKVGEPVHANWNCWSIAELIPVNDNIDLPIVKATYKVNLEQMWFFRYNLETGEQNQNLAREEFNTLGKYPKFGYGKTNYISGSVSALLGSEIKPYKAQPYIERMWYSRDKTPITTNDRALMLQQWRALVSSKNPKLLKDMKGQSWIVQTVSSSSTVKNFYKDQPDTISFEWKQVGSTDGAIIYGDITNIPVNNHKSTSAGTTQAFTKKPLYRDRLVDKFLK